jgi:hypothetical protein
MNSLKTDLNTFGYDPEELYFHLVNQELINRAKEQAAGAKVIDLNAARAAREKKKETEEETSTDTATSPTGKKAA